MANATSVVEILILDRHEAACKATGLPPLATDSAGLALGTGDLPDFREWGKI